MYKCECSERPMRIVESKTVMADGVPYRELTYACTNKNCSRYMAPAYRERINLLDRMTTTSEKL